MAYIKSIAKESKTLFLQSFNNNRVKFELDRAIVSFTFDDVPRSALEYGLPLLDKYGFKGTFYVATGLSKSKLENDNTQAKYFNNEDILSLYKNGHQIGCHTYSHYMLNNGNAQDLMIDAKQNVEEIRATLGNVKVEHFSYPFGQISLEEKKLLSQQYKTMRSSQPGINTSNSDMYLLRGTSFYSPGFSENWFTSVLENAVKKRGWIIFYSHGVHPKPGNYDCKPQELEWLFNLCSEYSVNILPVDKAYSEILRQRID